MLEKQHPRKGCGFVFLSLPLFSLSSPFSFLSYLSFPLFSSFWGHFFYFMCNPHGELRRGVNENSNVAGYLAWLNSTRSKLAIPLKTEQATLMRIVGWGDVM